jgi:hypothetical protein
MGHPVEQEEQEADVTVRTRTRTCLRCGETTVELENTRVAIDEAESQASQAQPTANDEFDANDKLELNEPPVQDSQTEPAPEEPSKSVEIPDYSPDELDDDEILASGDAVIIDESTEPQSGPEPAPQQFSGGGEIIEHAFGDTHQRGDGDETDYDHGAFKGDVTEEPEFSPDPGEILDVDGEAEASPEPEEPETRTQNANHAPDDSRLLQCRSCSFSEPHAGSALREGDICGSCGSSYLSLVDPSDK